MTSNLENRIAKLERIIPHADLEVMRGWLQSRTDKELEAMEEVMEALAVAGETRLREELTEDEVRGITMHASPVRLSDEELDALISAARRLRTDAENEHADQLANVLLRL